MTEAEHQEHMWLQIEQAAAGCVSGTLEEWPDLREALTRWGIPLPENVRSIALQSICLGLCRIVELEKTLSNCPEHRYYPHRGNASVNAVTSDQQGPEHVAGAAGHRSLASGE